MHFFSCGMLVEIYLYISLRYILQKKKWIFWTGELWKPINISEYWNIWSSQKLFLTSSPYCRKQISVKFSTFGNSTFSSFNFPNNDTSKSLIHHHQTESKIFLQSIAPNSYWNKPFQLKTNNQIMDGFSDSFWTREYDEIFYNDFGSTLYLQFLFFLNNWGLLLSCLSEYVK